MKVSNKKILVYLKSTCARKAHDLGKYSAKIPQFQKTDQFYCGLCQNMPITLEEENSAVCCLQLQCISGFYFIRVSSGRWISSHFLLKPLLFVDLVQFA